MAVAVVGTPAARTEWIGTSGTVSLSYACDAAATMLVVGVGTKDSTLANRTVSSVNWNTSEALTSVGVNDDGGRSRVEIYRLLSPTTGTHNVDVALGGSCNGIFFVYALSGNDTTTPVEATQAYSFDGSSPEGATLSSTSTGSLVIDTVYFTSFGGGTISAGAGQTAQINTSLPAMASYKTGGGSVSVSYSWTGGTSLFEAAGLAISVAPSSGGGGGSSNLPYPHRIGSLAVIRAGNF